MFSKTELIGLLATATLVAATPMKRASLPPTTPAGFSSISRRNAWEDVVSAACGLYPTANPEFVGTDLGDLTLEVSVDQRSCKRVGCTSASGVYVCNDQDETLSMTMQDVSDKVNYLYSLCEPTSGTMKPLSGQVFGSAHGGYNVQLGYCDEADEDYWAASDYIDSEAANGWTPFLGSGVNGTPAIVCGGNAPESCFEDED